MERKRMTVLGALAASALLITSGIAVASQVDTAVVDTTSPTGSVTLAPGASAPVRIDLRVTGNQVGTATFTVDTTWVLAGGSFTGSNPNDPPFQVDQRSSSDPADTRTTTGTVSVDCDQAAGTFTLAVDVANADISNDNETGAKLASGNPSNYSVTVAGAKHSSCPSDNTPPVVSVTGVSHGATYEIGGVPTAGCSVSDAEDTGESATPVLTGTLFHGLGSQTATCSYTDGGGLTRSASATYTIEDTGDPTISGAITSGTLSSTGWYTTFPTVTFTCDDGTGSGIQSCVADGTSPESASKTLTSDGADQSVGGTATDWAGNTDTDTVSNIDVDTTDPTNIQFTGVGGPYYFGSVPAAATFGCTAEDATSGLAGCSVSGYSSMVGTHELTATATDNAGNDSTAKTTYTVLAWTLVGFKSPVDALPTVNMVKGGSTVPLKFEAFAAAELINTNIVDTFKVVREGCGSSTLPRDDIETYSTGGTSLRYDETAGQFIQNWKTPATKGECYTVTLTLDDGSWKSAKFQTK